MVGRVRNAHGIRGDLVVEAITDAPAVIFAAGRRLFVGTPDGAAYPDRGRAPASTPRPRTVVVRLVSVSEPGTGPEARDYTAISELLLAGGR